MTKPEQPDSERRSYASLTRRRQAEDTRQRVLGSARRLFLQVGYAGTTVEAIAAAAEVSPKTVSAIFGSKVGVLTAILDLRAFGQRFDEIRTVLQTTDNVHQRVRLATALSRQAYEALTPEFELLRGASAVAPELADLSRQVGERRRQYQGRLIAYLRGRGVLCRELSDDEATDILGALTGYDLYRQLVVERGWTPERYETWVADVVIQRLIEPAHG